MTAARRLLDIHARAEAATPGPWVANFDDETGEVRTPGRKHLFTGESGYVPGEATPADARFVAAARDDVPRLVAALRACLDLASSLGSAPGITDRVTIAETLRTRIERELTS